MEHKQLRAGRWFELSLMEQMGNIGSEVYRSLSAKAKGDKNLLQVAAFRALELFDLSLSDPKLHKRQREIARVREIFCDIIFGNSEYGVDAKELQKYFDEFAYAARLEHA